MAPRQQHCFLRYFTDERLIPEAETFSEELAHDHADLHGKYGELKLVINIARVLVGYGFLANWPVDARHVCF